LAAVTPQTFRADIIAPRTVEQSDPGRINSTPAAKLARAAAKRSCRTCDGSPIASVVPVSEK